MLNYIKQGTYIMNNFFPSFIFASCTSLLLFSCAQPQIEEREVTEVVQNYKYTFISVGYAPISSQQGDNFDLQLLNAIKASKLEAYKELAEQIYGVLIKAENSVRNAHLKEDQIEAHVKGVVRGARVLKSYHRGDVYITELELNMQRLPFLRASEFNQNTSVIVVEPQIYY